MRILVHSSTFYPNIGGVEFIMQSLAEEWAKDGHNVKILTNIELSSHTELSTLDVIRDTSLVHFAKLVANANIFVEANISLKTFLIGLLNRKKWVVIHHLPYQHDKSWKGSLKNFITKFANNIAVSNYIKNTLQGKSTVIPNFFSPQFKILTNVTREKDIVFLGRLVSDKGVDILLDALYQLKSKQLTYSVTIIGDGQEKKSLMDKAIQLKLDNVCFVGNKSGEELVILLNEHKLMVIPSKWEEPYGIVALEGLASGCKVVYADCDGLREATNDFGLSFKRLNSNDLAQKIVIVLGNENKVNNHINISEYLGERTQVIIAKKYLSYFEQLS